MWLIEWLEEASHHLAALFGLVAAGGYVVTIVSVGLIGGLIWWRRSRLRRKKARFHKEIEAMRLSGSSHRRRMALRHQRRNVRELAVIVNERLEAVKDALHPCLYQRTTVAIDQAVKEVDFDHLYRLYTFFATTSSPSPTALEAILDRAPQADGLPGPHCDMVIVSNETGSTPGLSKGFPPDSRPKDFS